MDTIANFFASDLGLLEPITNRIRGFHEQDTRVITKTLYFPIQKVNNDTQIIESYEEGFASIDWDTMEKREYQDHNCCEICMAECLSPNVIHPSNFFIIFTKTDEINDHVSTLRNKLLGIKAFNVYTNKFLFVK